MKDSVQHHDESIDVKEVFRTILRYKVSIVLITLLFLIFSSIFAYYTPDIYLSNSTIEIFEKDNSGDNPDDFMSKAFGANTVNIDNEIAILESSLIIQKALETLNLQTRYYSIDTLKKVTELYKDSPFIVTSKIIEDPIYDKRFKLINIDDTKFNLVIDPISLFSLKNILAMLELIPLEESDKIQYNEIHQYGKEISTPWFTFTVNKISNFKAPEYAFNLIHKDSLYEVYSEGLSASLKSEFSSVVNINYKDTVSLRAKEILNAISYVYIDEGINEKIKSADLALGFIDSQLDTINTKLTTSERNLQNYKVKNKVINISSKVELATQKVSEYESEQSKLQTEINILNNLQHFMENNSDLGGLTIGTINFEDKSLSALVQNLQEMTDERSLFLVDYTDLHPQIIKLTKSIASTKRSIKKALSSSIRQLTQRNKDLSQIIHKYKQSINSLPGQEKQLAKLSRPLKVNESVYEYLLEKKTETAILKSSTIASARVIDQAIDEYLPIEPNRILIVIVGLILGLITGITLAFLREFLIYTVQNAEEVERLTSLPIYGVIPLNKDKMTKNIYTEAFRNIRTNLQFLPGNENNRVISITSSVSGEGKTTITAALSEVLARGGKKVIMLDLDMRKASLHKVFDIANDIGMSNFLTFQTRLISEVIKETNIYGLDIITTGALPPNPSELILSTMFTNLLEMLKEIYDYIIIDTPPAGLVTDATILMNYSDISFFVVRAKYTRKEFVKNIDRQAKEHSQNSMGIILNGTIVGSEYGYGYGASYAYGYGNAQYYKDRG